MKLIDFDEKEITIKMSTDEYCSISAFMSSVLALFNIPNDIKKIAQEFKDLTKEER